MANTVSAPAVGIPYFTPAQYSPAGSAVVPQPSGAAIPTLFQPIKIRGVEFHNRIFVRARIQLLLDIQLLTSGFGYSSPHSASTRRTMDVSPTGIKPIVSDLQIVQFFVILIAIDV